MYERSICRVSVGKLYDSMYSLNLSIVLWNLRQRQHAAVIAPHAAAFGAARRTHAVVSALMPVAMEHTEPTTYAKMNAPTIMHTTAHARSPSVCAGCDDACKVQASHQRPQRTRLAPQALSSVHTAAPTHHIACDINTRGQTDTR
jgi:hypothetical protein